MSLCERCGTAEYHGFPPKDAPEWEVGTVSMRCPARESHEARTVCADYTRGTPRTFDKRGVEL